MRVIYVFIIALLALTGALAVILGLLAICIALFGKDYGVVAFAIAMIVVTAGSIAYTEVNS